MTQYLVLMTDDDGEWIVFITDNPEDCEEVAAEYRVNKTRVVLATDHPNAKWRSDDAEGEDDSEQPNYFIK